MLEANPDPPRLAAMGAERWTRRNVEMNGAELCASTVRMEDAVTTADLGSLSGFIVVVNGRASSEI